MQMVPLSHILACGNPQISEVAAVNKADAILALPDYTLAGKLDLQPIIQ